MMSCPACRAALENPETGHLVEGCRPCNVRLASKQPRQIREAILSDVRMTQGDAAADQFLRDVIDEFNRRQAWKRSGR